jgi:hypothetical protein
VPSKPGSRSSPSARLAAKLADPSRYNTAPPAGGKASSLLARLGPPSPGAASPASGARTTGAKIRSRVWEDDVAGCAADTDSAAFDSWRQELSSRLGSAMRRLEPSLQGAL